LATAWNQNVNRPSPASLTARLVISAGLWTLVSLLAGGIVLVLLFQASIERSFDARLQVLLENLIVVTDYDAENGISITGPLAEPRFDQPYAGWYWQITPRDGEPLFSRSLWDWQLSPDLSQSASQPIQYNSAGPDDQPVRVTERDIMFPDALDPVRFSIAAVTTENQNEVSNFIFALIWALGALGVGLVGAVIIQVRFGLRPLRHLQLALGRVRSGDDERLEGAYPQEIAPVVGELNALIDHNSEVVERARTHVGNLAHALKTPLSVLVNETADPDGDQSDLARSVDHQVGVMRRYVDHYLTRARTAAVGTTIGSRAPVGVAVEGLRSTLEHIHEERDIQIKVEGGTLLTFRGERQDLEEMLGNLMDNACKWAASRVHVGISKKDGQVHFVIDDDGPGLTAEEQIKVFARGQRLDEAVPGSGLGLHITRDIARLYGGEVSLENSDQGGLRAILSLPASADVVPL
jgi:signal transduction histidine kinase